jgi:hypothetical protein
MHVNELICEVFYSNGGCKTWCSWLRHCARSWKVVGLIPDWVNDLILPVALWPWLGVRGVGWWWLTQLVIEMSTKNVSWGQDVQCYSSRYQIHVLIACKFWDPQPPGNLRSCPGLLSDCFTFWPMQFRSVKCTNRLL